MISKELNSADSRFARICSTALRSVICSSRPKRVAPISPGLQEKVQPASWIFRPNPYPSRFLTNLQPGAQGSLSNRRTSGKSVPSLIRMALGLFSVSTVAHFSAATGVGGSVSVGLNLCKCSSFRPPSSCHLSLQAHWPVCFHAPSQLSNNFTNH